MCRIECKDKECKTIYVVALDTCDLAFQFSLLRPRVKFLTPSTSVLSYAIHSWVNLRWNGQTWQAKTIIDFVLCHYFALKEYVLRTSYERDRHSVREPVWNRSIVRSADLRHLLNTHTHGSKFKTRQLYSFGHHVLWCWMIFYEIGFLSTIRSNVLNDFSPSRVWRTMFDSFGQPVKHCLIHTRALSWA